MEKCRGKVFINCGILYDFMCQKGENRACTLYKVIEPLCILFNSILLRLDFSFSTDNTPQIFSTRNNGEKIEDTTCHFIEILSFLAELREKNKQTQNITRILFRIFLYLFSIGWWFLSFLLLFEQLLSIWITCNQFFFCCLNMEQQIYLQAFHSVFIVCRYQWNIHSGSTLFRIASH